MKEMPDILWLEEIRKEDIPAVGGKGASLGEMSAIGLPVPRAFVVTSYAFRQFLVEAGLDKTIFADLAEVDVDNSVELGDAATKAEDAVMKARIPELLKKKIKSA